MFDEHFVGVLNALLILSSLGFGFFVGVEEALKKPVYTPTKERIVKYLGIGTVIGYLWLVVAVLV